VAEHLKYLQYKDHVQTTEFVGGQPVHEFLYQIESNQVLQQIGGLSVVFEQMVQMKREDGLIVNFQVTRSSLEQVFVSFAKHQIQQPNMNAV
jgi:hypothetical protein